LENFIHSFQDEVDAKYNTLITRFARQLTHPQRNEETSLGNLFADLFAERAGTDVMFVGSGSIRVDALGPVVTLGDLYKAFPYDDALHRFTLSGTQLKRVFGHIMSWKSRYGGGECYQVNHGVRAVYNDDRQELETLDLNGMPVTDRGRYTMTMQGFHFKNAEENLGISPAELEAMTGSTLVTLSVRDVMEEYMRARQNQNSWVEGRLVYRAADSLY
jgi:5'-nucleotidase